MRNLKRPKDNRCIHITKEKHSYLCRCCHCFHRPMGCCASFVLLHDRSGFCVVWHVKAPPTFPIVGWWSMYFKTTISTKKHRLKCKWDTRFIVTTRLRLVWHGVVSARLVQLPPYYNNDETGSKKRRRRSYKYRYRHLCFVVEKMTNEQQHVVMTPIVLNNAYYSQLAFCMNAFFRCFFVL